MNALLMKVGRMAGARSACTVVLRDGTEIHCEQIVKMQMSVENQMLGALASITVLRSGKHEEIPGTDIVDVLG